MEIPRYVVFKKNEKGKIAKSAKDRNILVTPKHFLNIPDRVSAFRFMGKRPHVFIVKIIVKSHKK